MTLYDTAPMLTAFQSRCLYNTWAGKILYRLDVIFPVKKQVPIRKAF